MKKISKNLIAVLLVFFGISLCSGLVVALYSSSDLISQANAQNSGMLLPEDRPPDAVNTEFREAMQWFLNYFFLIIAVVLIVAIIYSIFLSIKSLNESNQKVKELQIKKAKKIFFISLLILLFLLYLFFYPKSPKGVSF